ncbi:unnamed protein product [Heligmosomoides polygyrus]|uniref:Uncharacterized protein n=1 Tax=Heligmosomoides polygyrus TaxID=6339 RepID=A0A3P7U600_HELPZ|nr:unnamed protein product [Heligmosomoides polygyrus]
MRQLSLGPNSVAKALSVTTRGVGFTSAFSYCFFKDVEPRLAATNCTVNTVYRVNPVSLLQTQLSLSHAGIEYLPHIPSTPPLTPGEPEEPPSGAEEIAGTSRKRRRESAPPTSAPEEPRFVPDPFTVTIRNLRQNVEALSNVATPVRIRRYFHLWNPIPGAIWADDLLTNPDEICPDGYMAREDLWDRDIYLYNNFYSAVSKRFESVVSAVNLTGVGDRRSLTSLDHSNNFASSEGGADPPKPDLPPTVSIDRHPAAFHHK